MTYSSGIPIVSALCLRLLPTIEKMEVKGGLMKVCNLMEARCSWHQCISLTSKRIATTTTEQIGKQSFSEHTCNNQ